MANKPEITVKLEIDLKPQLCPKCNGGKNIQHFSSGSINYDICDVCNGKGIVWPPEQLINAIKDKM